MRDKGKCKSITWHFWSELSWWILVYWIHLPSCTAPASAYTAIT